MSKRRKKKPHAKPLRRAPSSTQQPASAKAPTNSDLVLRAKMPGALMFQRPYPAWVLPHDPPRRSQISSFGSSAAFAHVPEEERQAIFESAAKSYTRAEHYEARFKALRLELDRRRESLPGEVFWDGLVEYVHFELQAFAGACRTLLDELVYIIARQHSVAPARARRRPWETAHLVKEALEPECDVPEIQLLRTEQIWFDTLNAYRNSFFHHGWRHGWGHFSANDLRDVTGSAASNGLLLPDRESLGGRRKPFEWTWEKKTTADDVATEIRRGTEWLVEELGKLWGVPVPAPGTMPLAERPNMLVRLVRPGLLYSDSSVFLPIFTSREGGLACRELNERPKLELVDAPIWQSPSGSTAIAVALHGIKADAYGPTVTHLDVVLDPEPDASWKKIKAKSHVRLVLRDLASMPSTEPLVIPLTGYERVWLWQSTLEGRTW